MKCLRQWMYSLSAFASHLRRAPANFLLNMLALAMTLTLPFCGVTLIENLKPVTAQLEVHAEISVFIKQSVSREVASTLAPSIRDAFSNVGQKVSVTFVPREKALEVLKSKTGLSEAIAALGGNPLPDAYLVRLENELKPDETARIEQAAEQLKRLPNVDKVQLDFLWIKRLATLMHVLNMVLIFLASTLGIVVVAVAFNTIRLQMMSHLDEIALLRLVGATDGFIRRPFHYMGAILGFGAGCIALLIATLALFPLNVALADLAALYALDLHLSPLSFTTSAMLLGVSAILGWLGAALSVRRNLGRID
ncbi:MAG: ABC transporter permease [Oxalobacter sp.]|nr:MAG: ABC transporter permease [Oxalobacter sp.]